MLVTPPGAPWFSESLESWLFPLGLPILPRLLLSESLRWAGFPLAISAAAAGLESLTLDTRLGLTWLLAEGCFFSHLALRALTLLGLGPTGGGGGVVLSPGSLRRRAPFTPPSSSLSLPSG